MVGHLCGRCQQLEDIGPAGWHNGQLGQVGTGVLHGDHSGDQFSARRRLLEIVAGTDDLQPGGVRLFDESGQGITSREELNIQQVGTAGVTDSFTESRILLRCRGHFAALGLGAEGDEQKHFAQRISQTVQAVGKCSSIQSIFKPVDTPFNTIRFHCGKLGGFFQNGRFRLLDDGQDNFGAALSDGTAPNQNTRHNKHAPS